MQEELKPDISKPRTAAGLGLGAACLGVAACMAWGYGRAWTGAAASQHGVALDASWGSVGLWTGAVLALALGALGLLVSIRPSSPTRQVSEWLPVIVVSLLVGLAAMALQRLPSAASQSAPTYVVEVIGQQFEWLVRYPGPDRVLGRVKAELVHVNRNPAGLDASDPAAQDDVVLRSQLKLPLGEPCVVQLRSLDVLHSFNIEDFRIRRGVLPGYPVRVEFTPTEAGEFELSCAALCGLGHYRMSGKVQVLPRAQLESWLATKEPWL